MFKKGKSGNPAGRKKGEKLRPQFRDYFTEKERIEMIEMVKTHMVDDLKLLQFAVEMNFGKAPQAIDHTTLGEKLPTPILASLNVQGDQRTS